MALTREGSAQIAAVLKAMRAKRANTTAIIAQIDHLSINHRRHLFATTGKNSMLQQALRVHRGLFLAYMLEQHASDPSLPLDVDLILRHTRDHGNRYKLSWSSSPLWQAALLKKVSVVALLLAHGADVKDMVIGYTPLHACLYRPIRSADTLRIAEMLIHHGASLTYADNKCNMLNRGETPLMLAARNHPQLVNVILERLRAAGHDVTKYVQACDSLGRTALHYVTGGNANSLADVDVVTSLCKEGADLYARDYDGRDAFMACCYWLNERSNGIYLTPGHIWSRINYWIGRVSTVSGQTVAGVGTGRRSGRAGLVPDWP